MVARAFVKAYRYARYVIMTIKGLKLGVVIRGFLRKPSIFEVFVTKKQGGAVSVIAPYYSKLAFLGSRCRFKTSGEEYHVKHVIVREPEQSCLIALYALPAELRNAETLDIVIYRGKHILFQGVLKNVIEVKPRYELAATTLIKFEGRFLPEWIEHHLRVGVEHFYIYDNNEPGEGEVHAALQPYIERGVATYQSWPHPYRIYPYIMKPFWPTDSHMYTQLPQMHHALYRYAHESSSMLFCDVDEYFYSPKGESLTSVVRRHNSLPFLRIKGWFFGGSREEIENVPGLGVVRSFLYSEPAPTSPTKLIVSTLSPEADAMSVHEVIERRERMECLPEQELVFNHYRAFGWRNAVDPNANRVIRNDTLAKL